MLPWHILQLNVGSQRRAGLRGRGFVEVLINLLHHHLLSCQGHASLLQRLWELAGRSCHHQLKIVRHLIAEVLLHLEGPNLLHLTLKESLVFGV